MILEQVEPNDDHFVLATIGDFLHQRSIEVIYNLDEDFGDMLSSISTFCWTACRTRLADLDSPALDVVDYVMSWFNDRDWEDITNEELFSLVFHCECLAGRVDISTI